MFYIQRESANIWKKNVIKDLERELLNYEVVGKILKELGWKEQQSE